MNINDAIKHCEYIAKNNGDSKCCHLYKSIAIWLRELRNLKYPELKRQEKQQKKKEENKITQKQLTDKHVYKRVKGGAYKEIK